ncbi:hypothetical protein BC828DRAFT_380359 [Blastocladiella britannica]|nr:hypothetical protein BC828DRAFT_380359 [Blastocladiella britannica]
MTVLQNTYVVANESNLLLEFAAVNAKLRTASLGAAAAAAEAESSTADPVMEEARSAIEGGKAAIRKLTDRYAAESASLLNVPESQIEGFFALLLSLVSAVAAGDAKAEEKSLLAVAKALEESSSEKGIVKIKLLTHLFNAIPATSAARMPTYLSLAKVAAKHGELSALAPSVGSLADWARVSGYPTDQLSALYTQLADKYVSAGAWDHAVSALVALLAHVYASAGIKKSPTKAVVEPIYAKALVAALAPARAFVDLTALWVSPATEGVLAGTPMVDLVDALVHGDYAAYKRSAAANAVTAAATAAAFPKTVKSVPATATLAANAHAKARTVYLTTLRLGAPHALVDIAAALDIKLTSPTNTVPVEALFISAVSLGLVKGKIAGPLGAVTLTHAAKPHLEVGDWEAMLGELAAWKAGLENVGRAVHRLREDEDEDETEDDLDHDSDMDRSDDEHSDLPPYSDEDEDLDEEPMYNGDHVDAALEEQYARADGAGTGVVANGGDGFVAV